MIVGLRIRSGRSVLIIIGLLIGIYLMINLALPRFPIGGVTATYVIQPILWGLLAWAIIVLFPKYRPAGKQKIRSSVIQLALMIGFFQVLLYVIGGLFSGFGQSPYSFSPLGIITNLIFIGSMLIGMEVSRAWLINQLGRKHVFLALIFVSLFFTLLSISLVQITSLNLDIELITFLNSNLLPLLVENLLATLLALLAGPLASISYRGILLAFWWFCPILPDLSWTLRGLIGTLVPIIGIVVVNIFYSAHKIRSKSRKRAKEGFPVGWLITAIIAVVIVWFSVGLFPLHPSLVLSGSMSPTMEPGDIVIIAKGQTEDIKPGDIIQFMTEEEITIMHRVVDIVKLGDSEFFMTKGDANDKPDIDLVNPENVIGRVVFIIPKIGWVAIVVKDFFAG